ncbi:unnamed protein product [Adineta ricciae]|uniref:Reverse transcriptase domain-containing protein n=1 Tax=Adineta ricciae TaxID=249248 RepID=A0A816BQZ8_ADIRI|nr:unnamed protein product [Adineta ricciae]CAF1614744.1 unnamed protein product [Adineta ricciae]
MRHTKCVYAPDSKSWSWDHLSPFVTERCVFFGDFNVDFEQDKAKADLFTDWLDKLSLTPYFTALHTSKRSKRKIDYALTSGFSIALQTYEGNSSSDHKPILAVLPTSKKETIFARNVHWNVFTLFCEYVFPQWEKIWHLNEMNKVYEDYTSFLALLTARCTVMFPLDKYRIALPKNLRAYMSHTRALSFKQKRSGDTHLRNTIYHRRKAAKFELKRFLSNHLAESLAVRNTSSPRSISFWSKVKRSMKSASSSLHGFIVQNNDVIKDRKKMCEIAANYYENFFNKPQNIYYPHPYTDIPEIEADNYNEKIPLATVDEVLDIVLAKKKKKSCDAHALSNYMFNFLPLSYWTLMTEIFNDSFLNANFPNAWKDSRILLLAKKEHICEVNSTRPISLLDVFLKVNEKLFQTRFNDVLLRRGILPDNQSGFRESFRLQTRVLLFFEQVASLMSNSSPIATIFVDFKAAFDQLWFEGCIGKLRKMNIPKDYLSWIYAWLTKRRAYIEIEGIRSRWFNIYKGCPQGSIFSPTLFIAYHADMGDFLGGCLSHFFADDLAAIVAGSIGMKYTLQCIELERKLQKFLENLEYYSILTSQPINFAKTEGLWSARAVGAPKFDISSSNGVIQWSKKFKYLGYWITPKCKKYWEKYFIALSESKDGELLLEQANLNTFREMWRNKEMKITQIRVSKRFVEHVSVIEKVVRWCHETPMYSSLPDYDIEDISTLADFPETF